MTMQTSLPEVEPSNHRHRHGDPADIPPKSELLAMGLRRLDAHAERIEDMHDSLESLSTLAPKDVRDRLNQLRRQLDEMEPSVTILGQIKSGKTTLINAMIGRPGLLPADVNPWTTVVTSLHVNAPRSEAAPAARFTFFTPAEWEAMGRAERQASALTPSPRADGPARSGSRGSKPPLPGGPISSDPKRPALSGRFEMLLGQQHVYDSFSEPLIESYVCHGDGSDGKDASPIPQKRFAEITKSADLYLDVPEIPVPLCLRDTPGVNDSVLAREHLTIEALRDSRTCVVVLSAHQALSSVDLSLMRLIANIPDREIVLFVNRIDELSDPAREVPEIYESLLSTLSKLGGPTDPSIIFGSADWANIALTEDWPALTPDSADALYEWGNVALEETDDGLTPAQMVWKLSGLPALYEAIGARIVAGPGRELLNHTARRAVNVVQSLQAVDQPTQVPETDQRLEYLDLEPLDARLVHLEEQARTQLTLAMHRAAQDFTLRVDQSHARFLNRATEALLQHLEQQGDQEPWTYSPQGLRMLLRSSHQALARRTEAAAVAIYGDVAAQITAIYTKDLGLELEGFAIEPPLPPLSPGPVGLGKTISLDVSGTWWTRWWRRRKGYRVFSADFRARIARETAPLVNHLTGPTLHGIQRGAHDTLEQFLGDQRAALMDVAQTGRMGGSDVQRVVGRDSMQDRAALLEVLLDELKSYVHLGSSEQMRAAPVRKDTSQSTKREPPQ